MESTCTAKCVSYIGVSDLSSNWQTWKSRRTGATGWEIVENLVREEGKRERETNYQQAAAITTLMILIEASHPSIRVAKDLTSLPKGL